MPPRIADILLVPRMGFLRGTNGNEGREAKERGGGIEAGDGTRESKTKRRTKRKMKEDEEEDERGKRKEEEEDTLVLEIWNEW